MKKTSLNAQNAKRTLWRRLISHGDFDGHGNKPSWYNRGGESCFCFGLLSYDSFGSQPLSELQTYAYSGLPGLN